jgi:hypothetical protein
MRVLGGAFALLLSVSTSVHAWVPSSSSSFSSTTTSASTLSTTRLFNVPPPSTSDKVAFQEYASKQSPPASFFELQQDCIRAAKLAIDDGLTLLEVEFPPLPANVLEMDDVSAYDVASANLNLALEFSKGFTTANNDVDDAADKKKSQTIQNVAIMLPDEDEARIAIERMTGKKDTYIAPTTQMEKGITISSLKRSEEGDDRILKVRQLY